MEDKIVKEFKITIEAPLTVASIPTHLTIDYIMKIIPHVLQSQFKGEAEIKIEDITKITH